ncbi:MAG: VOC family protein, partial [Gammaproteobacteria bacterium]|nr:VOC family protein [Gammaproteobacteria bacterium]
MSQHLSLVSILVDDYDQAIEFYTQKLGFELTEDTPQGDKRWVVVAPRGS